ncbi:MAG: TfoX/Sxy family protein [Actinomycetia bacterium]|nr:TfoX/Sxy family protein [Actinomycetes bacterium]
MNQQSELIERLRALLAEEPSVREVSMFGGRSFMVNDKMVASALKEGDILVRVDNARHEELLALRGAAQAEMGAGRSMGPGWISVSATSIAHDESLPFWLGVALDYNQKVTGDQSPRSTP